MINSFAKWNIHRNIAIDMKKLIRSRKYDDKTEDLARFAKALGHPTRISILKYLDQQSCCFTGDLVDVFPLAQSTVSQHLKELKNAGLIQGEVKPPKIKYCIHQDNWKIAQMLFNDFFSNNTTNQLCSV